MGDEVGVQPGRLNELASKLEQLRDVLAANAPTIVSTLNEYWSAGQGTPINLSALQQAQHKSAGDATAIRARSNLAIAWQEKAVAELPGGMVSIPWLTKEEQLDATSGPVAAELLAQAEAESAKDPEAARAEIQEIETEIQYYTDQGPKGIAWLVAFYNQASPQVANLAATLNREDGQKSVDGSLPAVLTPQDKQILKTFATGLAYADKNGTLSPTAINAYAQAKNLWSVGMLFKFGPPGSAYGMQESGTPPNVTPNLLAKVTTAIELARMDGGYAIPLTGVSYNASGSAEVTQLLQEFDPSQAMLTLATQNGVAAREVLGDQTPLPSSLLPSGGQDIPIGQAIANDLMLRPTTEYFPDLGPDGSGSLRGFYPNPVPTSYGPDGKPTDFNVPLDAQFHPVTISPGVIANFFNTATSVPRGYGTPAYESAQSAMNIIAATPSPGQAELPAPVQHALLNIAQRYMADLAMSVNNQGKNAVQALGGGNQASQGVPWIVMVYGQNASDPNASSLSEFLKQIASNPADAGVFEASIKATLGQYYAYQATHNGEMPEPFAGSQMDYSIASLYGRFMTEVNNYHYEGAALRDEQHAAFNALLAFGESSIEKAPVVGAPLGTAQAFVSAFGVNVPQFSTNNAATTAQTDAISFSVAGTQLSVPMVQALINDGVFPASSLKNYPWYRNGVVVVNSNTESSFTNWFYGKHGGMYDLEKDQNNYEGLMLTQKSTSSDPGS